MNDLEIITKWDFCDRCKRGIKPLQAHDWEGKLAWLCEKCIENVEDKVKSEKGLFDEE